MTTTPLTNQQLAERIVAGIRDAAYDCDGNCGLTERDCDSLHPIQVAALHHGVVASVYADVAPLAEAVLAVVQPELDRMAVELAALDDLRIRALDKNEKLRAELATAQAESNVWKAEADLIRGITREAKFTVKHAASTEQAMAELRELLNP